MPSFRSVKSVLKSSIVKDKLIKVNIQRTIGVDKIRHSPFLLFDHFNTNGAEGFQPHPHFGLETVTYMTKGAFAHEDFTGAKGVTRTGDLQFMTSGRGVVHTEMPVQHADGSFNEGLQLWVDMPNDKREAEPLYRDLKAHEIPEAVSQDGKVRVKVISGESYGIANSPKLSSVCIHYYHFFMKPGSRFVQKVPSKFNFFLYVNKGSLVLPLGSENNATQRRINQGENVLFNMDGDSIAGQNLDTLDELEFVLVGGEYLDQETIVQGPFAAATKERIKHGFKDYEKKQNAFQLMNSWVPRVSKGVTDQVALDLEAESGS